MRKGISPLIAVIMLIAFTMIVAGILAGWATQFVTQSRSELQFCSRAQLLIQRAYFNNATKELTLALFNTGDVSLSGYAVRLTYQNETIVSTKFETSNISYQDIKTVVLSSDDTLKEVLIQSLECRGAQDLVGRYDIQGLGFRL
ncbi:MAG: archaellin/type IV pilin N-terminal domain-containing protein [Candidatus Aenigmarchaeota archaeon]